MSAYCGLFYGQKSKYHLSRVNNTHGYFIFIAPSKNHSCNKLLATADMRTQYDPANDKALDLSPMNSWRIYLEAIYFGDNSYSPVALGIGLRTRAWLTACFPTALYAWSLLTVLIPCFTWNLLLTRSAHSYILSSLDKDCTTTLPLCSLCARHTL